ncbi:hypothetical protein GGS23DRAFT_326743 [Durotheca rogersii]|uniref:uncharacterized protein n=1 Tax=Durotheca rogersii TaxID=419775 RepID=UPI00221EEDF7|nr:uncharacterized protein GGS23DRAFT_326743 [Durotheca rogersii]KAI5859250.1 hypothetical protein GGS23DRAFT_326743 [Durotheca rogersii]
MSEYWKSTPKYWCKHCSTYVRDTKLERTNHEATAKHQGALKRFLRDLHRGHDKEQREKEYAKREIERLNGVVGTSSSKHAGSAPAVSTGSSSKIPAASSIQASDTQRQRQWEQLATMGIDVPTELRGEMAMAGEWTVTNTRVIDDAPKPDTPGAAPGNVDAIAIGSRKRPKKEDDDEEEENTIRSLSKKSRRWGRGENDAADEDAELDTLLSTTIPKSFKVEEQHRDTDSGDGLPGPERDYTPSIKLEHKDDGQALAIIPPASSDAAESLPKQEAHVENETPTIVFKKRKAKNIRQR